VLDSGSTTVYIDGIIAVDPVTPIEDRVIPYPNPVRGELFLQWGDHKNLLESVSIVDVTGRMWRVHPTAVSSINVSDIPSGIYFLTIQYSDGVKAVYKLRLAD
jgi:hypothetical protein